MAEATYSKSSPAITITKSFNITPEIRNDIKESLVCTLRTDHGIFKEVLQDFTRENPNVMKEVLQDFTRENPNVMKEVLQDFTRENHLLKEEFKAGDEVVEFRTLDKDVAQIEILDFIKQHPGALTSEIIDSLNLDPLLVMEILKKLKASDSVESTD